MWQLHDTNNDSTQEETPFSRNLRERENFLSTIIAALLCKIL